MDKKMTKLKGSWKMMIPVVQDNGRQKRPANMKQMKNLEFLMAMNHQYKNAEETVMGRLDLCEEPEKVKKLYRNGMAWLDKAINTIFATLPQNNINHLFHLGKQGECMIRMRPVCGHADSGTIPIDIDDLDILIEEIIRNGSCHICMAEGYDAKRCKLRKVLQNHLSVREGAVVVGNECPYIHTEILQRDKGPSVRD